MVSPIYQTIVEMPHFERKTGYDNKNMFIGSCFTENIGNQMASLKYQVDVNPFGILYNPYSVATGINTLMAGRQFKDQDLVKHNGMWHSFFHHGRFSSESKEEAIELINNRISTSASFLKQAHFLFITFGTAWVYRYNHTGMVVSNCHKLPDKSFKRFRLDVSTITDVLGNALKRLLTVNPAIKIVFTVSPIRHWKDGAVENQRSKAVLLLAAEQLISDIGSETCSYFPAYEIVMDELRDYRFYADDMLHPSTVAVRHIWDKFQMALIDAESIKKSKEIQKLNQALNHKPINKFTDDNLTFLKQTLKKINVLAEQFPYLNFQTEEQSVINKINEIEAKNG